ncbi:hypothetical protein N7488_004780 [Penicillium malachiteum]|nr:hypothetical protein N7488_004780 [Penicillium malachiteum]
MGTEYEKPPTSVFTPGEEDRSSNELNPSSEAQHLSEHNGEPEDGDVDEFLPPAKLLLVMIALILAVFCLALDNTIIVTAIPRITDDFHSLDDVGWYGSAYLLTSSTMTLLFGKIYTFYPLKWIYLLSLFIFELGSLICGVSPNSVGLICGRAVAGLGAAGLFSGSLLILTQSVPLNRRPLFTGLIEAGYGAATVAGPLLGGAFTDRLTWRWCFYINLPFGAVTGIGILFFFKSSKSFSNRADFKSQLREFDPIGNFFLLVAIVCLFLATQWGGSKYAWDNARIIVLFILAAIFAIIFAFSQYWLQERATMPPRLLLNRNVWGCLWYCMTEGGAFFLFIYYLPIWFQAIKGVSAIESGIMGLPLILGQVISALVASAIVTIFGYYTPFLLLSAVFMSVGSGLLSTLEPNSDSGKWIGFQIILAIGVGLGRQQPFIAVQAALPTADIPTATSLMVLGQTLGGAVFIAAAQAVFQNELVKNLRLYAPDADVGAVLRGGATSLRQNVPQKLLPAVLQAYNDAITHAFYIGVALAAACIIGPIFVEWKSVKGGGEGSSTELRDSNEPEGATH